MRPLLLHASSKATDARPRQILHAARKARPGWPRLRHVLKRRGRLVGRARRSLLSSPNGVGVGLHRIGVRAEPLVFVHDFVRFDEFVHGRALLLRVLRGREELIVEVRELLKSFRVTGVNVWPPTTVSMFLIVVTAFWSVGPKSTALPPLAEIDAITALSDERRKPQDADEAGRDALCHRVGR
jgi:hypothetical protein